MLIDAINLRCIIWYIPTGDNAMRTTDSDETTPWRPLGEKVSAPAKVMPEWTRSPSNPDVEVNRQGQLRTNQPLPSTKLSVDVDMKVRDVQGTVSKMLATQAAMLDIAQERPCQCDGCIADRKIGHDFSKPLFLMITYPDDLMAWALTVPQADLIRGA